MKDREDYLKINAIPNQKRNSYDRTASRKFVVTLRATVLSSVQSRKNFVSRKNQDAAFVNIQTKEKGHDTFCRFWTEFSRDVGL